MSRNLIFHVKITLMTKKIVFLISFLVLTNCGSDLEQIENQLITTPMKKTQLDNFPAPSTTSLQQLQLQPLPCLEDDNTSIDFNNLKNVQNFLNRYILTQEMKIDIWVIKLLMLSKNFKICGLKPDGDQVQQLKM